MLFWNACGNVVNCGDLWFEVNCLVVSKDIYTERFFGKCINQLLVVRTGINEALTNILCTRLIYEYNGLTFIETGATRRK